MRYPERPAQVQLEKIAYLSILFFWIVSWPEYDHFYSNLEIESIKGGLNSYLCCCKTFCLLNNHTAIIYKYIAYLTHVIPLFSISNMYIL